MHTTREGGRTPASAPTVSRRAARVDDLARPDLPEVVDVLMDAFGAYPVLRFVLGPRAGERAALGRLVTYFATARVLRREPMLGVREGGRLLGVALLSSPASATPPELEALRSRLWAELGPPAEARYERYGRAASTFTPEGPHVHLNMLGVRTEAQGTGLGRALLEAVHARAAADTDVGGVSLATEVRGNVSLYRHFGYEVLGRVDVAPGLTTWSMFRPKGGREGAG